MDLYIAICEDRHVDVIVKVFTTEKKAIDYVKEFVGDFVRVVKEVLNNKGE